MPSFKIAIPSHRRAEGCVKKTLAFLAEHLVPPEIIHLFLEADDVPDYILPPDYRPHIIPGRPGTKGQRAAIEDFFPIGSRLICLDDDITGLKVLGCPEYNLIDLLEEAVALLFQEDLFAAELLPVELAERFFLPEDFVDEGHFGIFDF